MRYLILFLCSILFAQGTASHGSSLRFDGTGDYVNCGNNASLNSYPITISIWIKTTSTGVASRGVIIKYAAASFNGYMIFVREGRIKAWYWKTASDYTRQDLDVDDGGIINDNIWHHVVYTVNSSGGEIYVDGVSKNTKAWTGIAGITTTTQDLVFGFYSIDYFNGTIGEVQIYSRALELPEIQWLYRHPGAVYDATDLEGWWKFNEFTGAVAGDSSGNANDGTITNATWSIDTPVSIGSASHGSSLYFDGAGDKVDISADAYWNNFDDEVTIEAWVKPLGYVDWHTCVTKHGGSYGTFGFMYTTADWRFFLTRSGESISQFTAGSFTLGQWHHVVLTYDGNYLRGYINSIIADSLSAVGTIDNSNQNIHIACHAGNSHYVNGNIDEARIYDRTLGLSEIEWNFRHPTQPYDTDSLMAYWKFNEFTGAVLGDSSGNSKDGTITDATWSIDSP